MLKKSRTDLYQDFLGFVQAHVRKEREPVRRRMYHVLIWCFLLPILSSAILAVLYRLGWVPVQARAIQDWVILLFPVLYSIFFLGRDLSKGIPILYRKGGAASALEQAREQARWREEVIAEIKRSMNFSTEDWRWIRQNFQIDLDLMKFRTKYLTALGGAVFFLIIKGVDYFSDVPVEEAIPSPEFVVSWVTAVGNQISEIAVTVFFLVMLYLSGTEVSHSFERYLHCVELIED